MTDREGEAAIEAAAEAVRRESLEAGNEYAIAKAVLRAYLAALSGWRLVQTEGLSARHVTFSMEPPAPGLEESDHEQL